MVSNGIRTEEVSWKVMGVGVFGTLTYPDDGKQHPGVVLAAGSGPTDRDWCSPALPGNNGSGKLLAESLAGQGYVTLRYDKMASGPHAMENLPKFSGKLSMETHCEELAGALNALAAHECVEEGRVFALANSEGCIHAVNLQLSERRQKFSGLILTGAPGRAIGAVAHSQLAAQAQSLPDPGAAMAKYDEAVEKFLRDEPIPDDDQLPEGLKLMLNALSNPVNLPFSRELWTYSLPDHVKKIVEPVLVIIGKKDIQISWTDDGKMLEQALEGKENGAFAYPENANHVLKHEELPIGGISADYASAHYNSQDAELDEEALEIILEWLRDHS